MNRFFSLFFLFVVFLLVNISCKKGSSNPVDKLPPATTEGKNTFACLINGKPFIVNLSDNNQAILAQYWTTNYTGDLNYQFFIDGASLFDAAYGTVDIRASRKEPFKTGQTLQMADDNSFTEGNFTNGELETFTSSLSSSPKGEIVLSRVDTVNKILSGTFWFNAYDKPVDINELKITDGRFDIKYE